MSKKNFLLATIAGFFTALFISPVLKNLSVNIPYYGAIFVILPLLWIFLLFLSSRIKNHFPWVHQFVKFLIVGGLNTSIDFGILNIISMRYGIYAGVKIIGINPLSFVMAVTNSFFWNKYWTFGEKTAPEFKEAAKFLSVTMVGLFINTAVVFLITKYFVFDGFTPGQILNLAKAMATGVSMFWNFTAMRTFVFNETASAAKIA